MIIKVLMFVFLVISLPMTGFALGDTFGISGVLMGLPVSLLMGYGGACLIK